MGSNDMTAKILNATYWQPVHQNAVNRWEWLTFVVLFAIHLNQ